jgi:hypothetical protein
MIKIIAMPSGTIIGSTIVEERAGESIMEVMMAMEDKLKVSDLASRIHPSPTYNFGIQLLATEMAVERSESGFSVLCCARSGIWLLPQTDSHRISHPKVGRGNERMGIPSGFPHSHSLDH